jgi:hypothetical protein
MVAVVGKAAEDGFVRFGGDGGRGGVGGGGDDDDAYGLMAVTRMVIIDI